MTANELADLLDFDAKTLNWKAFADAATMLRQQQAEIEALYNLVAEQDKKIIDLAFKLAYAERSNEIVLEANQRSRP